MGLNSSHLSCNLWECGNINASIKKADRGCGQKENVWACDV